MKRRIKSLLCQLLVAGLGLMLEGRVMAQTFATVHNFTAVVFGTNGDGTTPITELILLGNTLYGTAYDGGTNGSGTVFAVNTNGTAFTTLHSFKATAGFNSTNSEGANPVAGLVLGGNTLYGTAPIGGTNGNGTVFAINTNGTGFTTLHTFTVLSGSNSTNSDGAIRCIFLSPSKGNAILVDDEKMLKTIEN